MKVLVCLVVLTFICVNALDEDTIKKIEEHKKQAEKHIEICVKENELDAEIAKKLTLGDFSIRHEKAQCFVNCFFKRAGFMNEKGEPQKDVIIEKLSNKTKVPHEQLEETVSKCIELKGENECETAFKIFECYWTSRVQAIQPAVASPAVAAH